MTRSPAEFDAAAEHVAYELTQFVDAARYVDLHPEGAQLTNACLESMLVHVRNLVDFLLGARRWPTDLHRDDFVGTWSPSSADASARLLDLLPVIHKHLAHLTWERVEQGQQAWTYPGIAADVLHVFDEFATEATAQRAAGAQTFERALAEVRASRRAITALTGATSTTSSTTSSRMDII